MARCIALGQAAGSLAAIAARQHCTVPEVTYEDLKEALLAGNAILEEDQAKV